MFEFSLKKKKFINVVSKKFWKKKFSKKYININNSFNKNIISEFKKNNQKKIIILIII